MNHIYKTYSHRLWWYLARGRWMLIEIAIVSSWTSLVLLWILLPSFEIDECHCNKRFHLNYLYCCWLHYCPIYYTAYIPENNLGLLRVVAVEWWYYQPTPVGNLNDFQLAFASFVIMVVWAFRAHISLHKDPKMPQLTPMGIKLLTLPEPWK